MQEANMLQISKPYVLIRNTKTPHTCHTKIIGAIFSDFFGLSNKIELLKSKQCWVHGCPASRQQFTIAVQISKCLNYKIFCHSNEHLLSSLKRAIIFMLC